MVTFTFPGLSINALDDFPSPKKLPYRRCISDAWLACNYNPEKMKSTPFEADDPALPILRVDIPDDIFDAEDMLWLEEDDLDRLLGDEVSEDSST
ncbi:hypothetical protein EVG20_g4491 [Dentipellis fragilis]|uniref:Uncharacterized protein n=1 Tax=Dentipellis fragilis TaxID=205917 RepID=A0A4Y9YYB6_9AGAM|nr:hypothetical protein EVG20_g4491 [Dentipellis fragilis]